MADADKNIRITTNKNKPAGNFPTIVFTGSSAGSSVVRLEVLDDNTLSFASNEGQIFSLDSNLTVGTIWSVNDVSGIPQLRSSAGGTVVIADYGGTVGIGESNPLHKLSVRGALAIGSTTTTNYTVFRFPSAGTGQTYILPSNYPGTGVSVLQSDTSGNLLWVAGGSGGGSGSVNSGTAGSVAFYPANGTAVSGTSLIQIASTGAAVTFYTNVDIYAQNDLRLFNSGSSAFTGLMAGSNPTSYTLTFPSSAPGAGAGFSMFMTDSTGNMSFGGFIQGTGTSLLVSGTGVTIRNRRPLLLTFASGYTPATGTTADDVVLRLPESFTDGTTSVSWVPRRAFIRTETFSAGSTLINLQYSTGTGVFTSVNLIGGAGLSVGGAGIAESSTTNFTATTLTSGTKLRVNFSSINAAHSDLLIYLQLEEL